MFNLELIRDKMPEKELKINRRKAVRGIIYRDGKILMVKTNKGDYKLPGGGVESDEDEERGLLRELAEETGYANILVGPCIGTCFEQNIDNYDVDALFQMESVYYLCELKGEEKVPTNLEEYEKELEFTPVWIEMDEALRVNKCLLEDYKDVEFAKTGMSGNDWLEREVRVLDILLTSYVDKIIMEVYHCGQMIKYADRSQLNVDGKEGHANFVTNYDKMVQEEIKGRLLKIFPDATFVGEEDDVYASISKGYAFIVDPIDGTTNFMKDYQTSCISVGMTYCGKQIAGIVYQPYLNEFFYAERGKGAFRNGRAIHVSKASREEALVVFGTAPYYEDLAKKSFDKAYEVFRQVADVRRSGSAAIDLCNVACGRADMYFEYLLSPWDHAAGSLIVKEAGGSVTTMEGEMLSLNEKCSVLATNGKDWGKDFFC